MTESLLVAGIVCIVAAIVGGGVKLLGAEMPVLNSFARQALLFVVGLGFLIASFAANRTKAPTPGAPTPAAAAAPAAAGAQVAGQGAATIAVAPAAGVASQSPAPPPSTLPAGCPEAAALTCLPKSSAPVVFASLAAANAAAAVNIRDGLSTSMAAANAARDGANGRAARLCGIVGSNDSSPLGKHLAAQRLNNPGPDDGHASASCLKVASQFL